MAKDLQQNTSKCTYVTKHLEWLYTIYDFDDNFSFRLKHPSSRSRSLLFRSNAFRTILETVKLLTQIRHPVYT